jgi:hypothetical protein
MRQVKAGWWTESSWALWIHCGVRSPQEQHAGNFWAIVKFVNVLAFQDIHYGCGNSVGLL